MTAFVAPRLGIRVAVLGRDLDGSASRRLLERDRDVEKVDFWKLGTDSASWDDEAVDVVVAEPGALEEVFRADKATVFRNLTLIVNLGLPSTKFPVFHNVEQTRVDESLDQIWPMMKYRALQRRLTELNRFVNALVHDDDAASEPGGVLELESTNGAISVAISAIDWARAAGGHVELRAGSHFHLIRVEMYTLEQMLPERFLRIHRRLLVNLERVLRIEEASSTHWFAVLVSGDRFPISRDRRTQVKEMWDRYQSGISPVKLPEVICQGAVEKWRV